MPVDSKLEGERIFDFVITSPDVIDSDGEIVPEEELEGALDKWLINNAPLSDFHSNNIVGRGLRWWKGTYKDKTAYFGRGKIHDNLRLADEVWDKIKDGTYADVSIGGAAWDKSGTYKGGIPLGDLEILEISPCPEGAHPLANITNVNEMAKRKHFFAKAKILKPFAEYSDFQDCVGKNQDKDDPKAYCATIQRQVEGDKKGGNIMTIKQEDEKPKEEEEKPKEEQEEVDKAGYVSKEEFSKFKDDVLKALESIKGAASKSSSVDGEAEEPITAEPKKDDAETVVVDEPEGGKVANEGLASAGEGETSEAGTEVLEKEKAKIIKEVTAEIKKKYNLHPTSRPVQVTKAKESSPAWDIITKSRDGKKASWRDINTDARVNDYERLATVMKSIKGEGG